MEIERINQAFSICRAENLSQTDIDTDYVLTKTADFERALAVLSAIGYETH